MKKLTLIISFLVLLAAACKKNNTPTPTSVGPGATITDIYPASGGYDTVITITGQNFSAIAANDTVKFNGMQAVVQSATTTSIKAVVPMGAGTGPVTVNTSTAGAVKGPVFTYNLVTNIYFGGTDGSNAVYWQNGVEYNLAMVTTLPPTTPIIGFVNNMAVSGSDVYIAGFNGKNSVFWKNGVANLVPVSPSVVAVSGTDIYIAGGSMYAKNGTAHSLPSSGTPGIEIMALSGNDVFFAGVDINPGVSFSPVYWKNGTEYKLPTLVKSASANVTGLAISGTDVYCAGTDGPPNSYTPVYWKNGVENTLPTIGGHGGWVSAMAISGSDIYFVGVDFKTGVYWKNGVETKLPYSNSINLYSQPTGIAVNGTDVYISGYEFTNITVPNLGGTVETTNYTAEYWKNGTVNTLPIVNSGNGFAQTLALSTR
jgi:hypothetical protein